MPKDEDDNFHMVINEFRDVTKESHFRKKLAKAIVEFVKNGKQYLVYPEVGIVQEVQNIYQHIKEGGKDPNIEEFFDTQITKDIESSKYKKAVKIALDSIYDQVENPYAIVYSSPKY